MFVVAALGYLTRNALWPKGSASTGPASKTATISAGSDRCIVQKLQETENECVVFYGSQTGNAQDYAEKLAREAHTKYGLRAMVADLEEYDYETICNFPENKIAFFVMSSYGEGEPTDNATTFFDFITSESPEFSEDKENPLASLHYGVFGLGNSTYEHYNAVIRKVDEALSRLGATRLGPRGEGDDAPGSMEEDFMAWKEEMWPLVCSAMNLQVHDVKYEASFTLTKTNPDPDCLYLGEHSSDQLRQVHYTSYGAHNPYLAPVKEARELFNSSTRNCIHLEIDISGTNLSYRTGDHLAVFPMNPSEEVDRFLRVFGLADQHDDVFELEPIDETAKVPFPTPTTFEAAARYYIDICGPVSRQLMSTLAEFSPAESTVKADLLKLANDKDYFAEIVSSKYLNLGQLIEQLTSSPLSVPFTALVEGLRTLQPRFYSISSSSLVQRNVVSITTVADTIDVSDSQKFYGVTSNYLYSVKQALNGEPTRKQPSYTVSGPRDRYASKVPVYVRQSSFRLPTNPKTPIIMIGPGTGVAPFRGFIQEKSAQVKGGGETGKMLLFYGCRTSTEDFIYQEEWKVSLTF